MGFNNFGLLQLGSFIKGDSPLPPAYLEFGTGSSLFDGTKSHNDNGFLRKPITWRWNGNNAQGTTILLTTDGVGSNIGEVGMGAGVNVGSNLYTRDTSAIGDKDATFTTTLSFDVRFSRPS